MEVNSSRNSPILGHLAIWQSPKVPETQEDIKGLSPDDVMYIRKNYKDYVTMEDALLKELVKRLPASELPPIPLQYADVVQLDLFELAYFYIHYDLIIQANPHDFVFESLHERFSQEDWPVISSDFAHLFRVINTPTVQGLSGMAENQLGWFLAFLSRNNAFGNYSLDDQIAINALFLQKLGGRMIHVSTSSSYVPTSVNQITQTSDSGVRTLHQHYRDYPEEFQKLSQNFKLHFNTRFLDVGKAPFPT